MLFASVPLLFFGLLDALVPPCWAGPFWQSPQKEPKRLAPASGPALRSGFVCSIAASGVGLKGHPGPFKPFAASMRLNPLRNDCAHSSERGVWWRLSTFALVEP